MEPRSQLFALFIIALPIAAVAWAVTHEELFREFHDICVSRSKNCQRLYQRKFFYLFTCEYCFSHYITAFFLLITRFKLLYTDWRGYLIGGFALVWISNVYIALFALLRLDLKKQRVEIKSEESNQSEPERRVQRIIKSVQR
jgi:hypothetical protein